MNALRFGWTLNPEPGYALSNLAARISVHPNLPAHYGEIDDHYFYLREPYNHQTQKRDLYVSVLKGRKEEIIWQHDTAIIPSDIILSKAPESLVDPIVESIRTYLDENATAGTDTPERTPSEPNLLITLLQQLDLQWVKRYLRR